MTKDIPFNNCELSLKLDATGNIASFKQFIPDVVNDSLKKFDIDYAAADDVTFRLQKDGPSTYGGQVEFAWKFS